MIDLEEFQQALKDKKFDYFEAHCYVFSDMDFSGFTFNICTMKNCVFDGCNFVGAYIVACKMRGTIFIECSFDNENIVDVHGNRNYDCVIEGVGE